MKLRPLTAKDAPYMLEWMHDSDVVGHLSTNFAEKTLDDCYRFIDYAQNCQTDLHMAVIDDSDQYMGTVSLKHISQGTAEFAVTVRACAMGKGYSQYGMSRILDYGITELGLDTIYWCVSKHNARAVRFYDKCGYTRTEVVPSHILQNYTPEQNDDFYWYLYNNQHRPQ